MKEAGGCAAGFTGRFFNFNSDAEQRLAEALMTVGKFVQGESGCLLGHIKAAVYVEGGEGITLNLIDMDNGVEHHGTMNRADEVKFNFMCAVLDVDEHELTHEMLHAIDDSGLDYAIDKESLEHHHHHEHEDGKECDDPDCDCHKHHHKHGEECTCGHHHHDGEECDDPNCECHHHHHSLADLIDENGRLRADHHHDHEHEHHHEHGEGCCCGHHHEHEHEHGEECHCHDHEHEHGEECHCHDHDEKAEPEKKEKKGFFSFLKRKK